MEFVDIEKLMHDKYEECNAWLGGKEDAVAAVENARVALAQAEAVLSEYNDEYIAKVVAYRDNLKARLGIVDEVVAEAHDEQPCQDCAEESPAPVMFGEQQPIV